MGRTRKLLLSLLVVGLVGTAGTVGTFSAFSGTTDNAGNVFEAGTVYLADNDLTSAMYDVTNAKPGTTVSACVMVTYRGSLDADVSLYTTDAPATLDPFVDLTIEKGSGSPTFPGCAGFVPESTIFTGTLAGFVAKDSFATGVAAYPGASTKWVTDDAVVYRLTLTLRDDAGSNGANGGSAGPLAAGVTSFTWEAQNQ